jgi:hypothetical protein
MLMFSTLDRLGTAVKGADTALTPGERGFDTAPRHT